MPVSIPTAADVRKAREQAAKAAAERVEVARTPALAVLGAGDLAVSRVTRVVSEVRTQAGDVQSRVAGLPQRLRPSELRRTVTELRTQAEGAYSGFAERGEQAWGRIRTRPQVKQVISTIESVSERLDARVDVLVDDAHDAAEKALRTVTRQTRSTGEKVARATQNAAAGAAGTVAEAAEDASDSVAKAGEELAGNIAEAGDEAAHETRSVSRKAANRTAPKAPAKPAARRTNGTDTTS